MSGRVEELREALRSALAWASVFGDDEDLERKSAVRLELVGDVVQVLQGEDVLAEMTLAEWRAVCSPVVEDDAGTVDET